MDDAPGDEGLRTPARCTPTVSRVPNARGRIDLRACVQQAGRSLWREVELFVDLQQGEPPKNQPMALETSIDLFMLGVWTTAGRVP